MGALNVDEEVERRAAAEERKARIALFAESQRRLAKEKKDEGTVEGVGGRLRGAMITHGPSSPTKKKDPFVGYSARRTSVNPLDGLSLIDKIMTQQRIIKEFKTERSPMDIMKSISRMTGSEEVRPARLERGADNEMSGEERARTARAARNARGQLETRYERLRLYSWLTLCEFRLEIREKRGRPWNPQRT